MLSGFAPEIFLKSKLSALFPGRDGRITAGEVGLPIKADGKTLPCGIYGRWEAAE